MLMLIIEFYLFLNKIFQLDYKMYTNKNQTDRESASSKSFNYHSVYTVYFINRIKDKKEAA